MYDPQKHHRRSIRLKGHDYAGGGCYFVTLCAHRRAGDIFVPAAVQSMVVEEWENVLEKIGYLGTHKACPYVGDGLVSSHSVERGTHKACPYVIMPDHFHAIIWIPKGDKSLGDWICEFKSRVVHRYISEVKAGRWPPFPGKIWHRNYFEEIVRSARALARISQYIEANPWQCIHDFGDGLRGIGNPALWGFEKLGVLCSRKAPKIGYLPDAQVYLGGWHSPKEQEILDWLLNHHKRVILCPAWPIKSILKTENSEQFTAILAGLKANRILILEMPNRNADLAAAADRNRFVIAQADRLFTPYVAKGGLLEKLLAESSGKRLD